MDAAKLQQMRRIGLGSLVFADHWDAIARSTSDPAMREEAIANAEYDRAIAHALFRGDIDGCARLAGASLARRHK